MSIDHSQHDHPSTKEARAACRAAIARYPRGEYAGTVFRDDDDGLWQRLTLTPDMVQRDDWLAGFQVIGISSDARHDNQPAFRMDLYQDGMTGRLVVQEKSELQAYRAYDPDRVEIEVDIDVTDAQTGTSEEGPARMLNYLLGLVGKTQVQPRILTWAGPAGVPIVRLKGPRKDVIAVLKVHDPENWEETLLTNQSVEETLDQVTEDPDATWYPKTVRNFLELSEFLADCYEIGATVRPLTVSSRTDSSPESFTVQAKLTVDQAIELGFGQPESTTATTFLDWQKRRIETLLINYSGEKWKPVRLSLSPKETPHRTIFNQPVRDGWRLARPTGRDPRYVGRELMAVLLREYPELFDVPEGFKP